MSVTKVFAVLVVFAVVSNTFGSTLFRKERSIENIHRQNRAAEKEKDICEHRSPCGWAVYKRFTRQIDFYMKNSCECPEGKKCTQDEDDISASAYVYRCVVQTPEEIEKEKLEKAQKEKEKREQEKKEEEETSRTR